MTSPSGDVPFAIDGQTLSSVERASESVGGPLQLESILLVAGLAVVAVGVLGVLTYLYTARNTVDREIEEVSAERQAFEAFASRIEGMPVEQTAGAMATPQTIQTYDTGPPPVQKVAKAFEETVMSLPHYRDTYGDDVLDQMAVELDADMVASLNRPGSMSDRLKQGLQQQARDAAAKRADLLAILAEERESLEASETTLGSVVGDLESMNERPLSSRSYSELQDSYGRLGTLAARVGQVSRERQHAIHEHTRTLTWNREAVTLQEYLYGETSPTYPVLDATARLDRLLERARSRVSTALWSRV